MPRRWGSALVILTALPLSACDQGSQLMNQAKNQASGAYEMAKKAGVVPGGMQQAGDVLAARPPVSAGDPCNPNPEAVKIVQQKLPLLGYDPGPADGRYTAKTDQVVRDYYWHSGSIPATKCPLTDHMVSYFADYNNPPENFAGPKYKCLGPAPASYTDACVEQQAQIEGHCRPDVVRYCPKGW
jgi:hypothetical protein